MKFLTAAGLSLFSVVAYADQYSNLLNTSQKATIESLVKGFQQNNIDAISQHIQYPLKRTEPLPSIKNPKEFKTRFSQIFDQAAVKAIANAKPSDWEPHGWQGVMFDGGQMWLTDYESSKPLKIKAVYYDNALEEKFRQQALQQQKQKLHASIQVFSEPALLFKTKDYLIRIDHLKNQTYRYVAWKDHQNQAKKPDLILKNGDLDVQGTARNEYYAFKSGPYTYEVHHNIIGGASDAEVTLVVSKGDKEILRQDGHLVEY